MDLNIIKTETHIARIAPTFITRSLFNQSEIMPTNIAPSIVPKINLMLVTEKLCDPHAPNTVPKSPSK